MKEQTEAASASPHRLLELDALRGLAAVGIVLYHYTYRVDPYLGSPRELFFRINIDNFPEEQVGLLLVYLFFMISGFVIFATIENCKRPMDFIVSRFSRLFPAYWAAVLLTFSVGLVFPLPGQDLSLGELAANLTMIQSYFGFAHVDGVYWSLEVELGFYFLVLILFVCGALNRFRFFAVMWLLMVVINQLAEELIYDRAALLFALQYGHYFVAGILLYRYKKGDTESIDYWLFGLCILTSWLTLPGLSAWVSILLFTVFGLAVTGWLPFLRFAPLVWLGAISYSLYLTHHMLGYRILVMMENLGLNSQLNVLITFTGAVLLAHLFTFGLERPALHFIRRAYRRHCGHP